MTIDFLHPGSSLSPDGRYGAALIRLPTASDYVLNTVYASTREGWKDHTGGNGDIQWVSLGESGGVMALGGEAPDTAPERASRNRGGSAP
jgi:hypothetical protein